VDENPHEPGLYSKKLLDEAPEHEEGYFKVKNIL
jgi:Asp-tRNA(Asn)/Glu-tRNA(Gln) amidotransferase C subunit